MSGEGSSSSGGRGDCGIENVSEWLGMDVNDDTNLYAVIPLTSCPHLNSVEDLPESGLNVNDPCETCGNIGENWVCLTCFSVSCGRYVGGHGVVHQTESSHPMALSYADLSVWCYPCEAYVHNSRVIPHKNSAHISKFNTALPTPSS